MTWRWLGSDPEGVAAGSKARLLDRAARAGLPVPRGVLLAEEGARAWIERGIDPGLPAFGEPVAVRSAFSAEDGAQRSLAGCFTSKLWVEERNLREAVSEVWESGSRRGGPFRRDVLVMEMVRARTAGVAFSQRDYEDDLVNQTEGTGDALVSGRTPGTPLLLPKLRRGERAVSRLQALLRDVRRVFGEEDWDVEWADDGERCWLLQVRPITSPPRRNDAFTIANHREILPDPPSRFMTSLIASSAPELFAYYRWLDPTLPKDRLFIEVFCGRPLINLSLLCDMMRHWGLPTRLVTDSIGGKLEIDVPFRPFRALRKLPVLARMGLAQLRSVGKARRTILLLDERARRPLNSFSACTRELRWLYVALVHEMFSLTAAMSGPLSLLRRAGTLAEHHSRQRSVSTEMFDDLAELRRLRERGDTTAFQTAWNRWMQRHGHRGVWESDVAQPRFHERPDLVRDALESASGGGRRAQPFSVAGLLTLPVWWQAGRALRAREQVRFEFMRAFDRVRQSMLRLAEQAVRRGQLPAVESVWLLDVIELSALDDGHAFREDWIERRSREQAELRQYQLPALVHRLDDWEQYRTGRDRVRTDGVALRGMSLTAGEVRGRAWVLSEPASKLPLGFVPAQTVLVAPSVDAGWIPTFRLVAGVIAEIGGELSHGSIILREIGLPAVTNVSGAMSWLQTGDAIHLRAGAGVVQRTGAP